MDISESLAISTSALDAHRRRLNVISSNLANAQSTHSPEGGPYKRREVVFEPSPVPSLFQRALRVSSRHLSAPGLEGVKVARVVVDGKPGQTVYDPKHPDADAKGYVQMPNVNVMEEMTNMISASRAFEANVQAINAARAMWNRALDIGR
ncbi:flagellar basal body rod protein FlgC [Candidatus Nitrospira bockiana]